MNRYTKWVLCVMICAFSAAALHHVSRALPGQNQPKLAARSTAAISAPVSASLNVATPNVSAAKPRPVAELRATPAKFSISAIASSNASSTAASTAAAIRPRGSFGQIPLSFEENRGQSDSRVKYLARGKGYTLFLTPDEAVLALRYQPSGPKQESGSRKLQVPLRDDGSELSRANLRIALDGANPAPRITGSETQSNVTNYYIGNDPNRWHTGVPNFARVELRDVYPGVNLSYYGNSGQLESDFIVAPRTDPGRIRMKFDGARSVRVNSAGDLILSTKAGEIRLARPVAYQTKNGAPRNEISARYELLAANCVSFVLGSYDRNRELTIDPTLVYSTYLGGSGTSNFSQGDQIHAIAVDAAGEAYVTGFTPSTDFPTKNAEQGTLAGDATNAFVTKFAADGQSLIFSTFLGGSGTDHGIGIALDSSKNAVVVGSAQSSDFPPLHPLTNQTTFSGGQCAFISQLTSAGALSFSSFLCGGNSDQANAVTLDANNNVYLAGSTFSQNFPTVNPLSGFSTLVGEENAFLTKLAPITATGSTITFSTYFGGNQIDVANAVALDSNKNVYLAGSSDSLNLPVKNAVQTTMKGVDGSPNAFVVEVNAALNDTVYCTYLGGSNQDVANGIVVDSTGNAYFAGSSTSPDFPLVNSLQAPDLAGDPFIAKIKAGGGVLDFSMLFGGGGDVANAIALDSVGNIYIAGTTPAIDFPTRVPLQASLNALFGGSGAAFVVEFKPDGSDYIFSTYLGGSFTESFEGDQAFGLALDPQNNIYTAGIATTFDFPTVAPFQTVNSNATFTGFVAKIAPATPTGPQVFPLSLNFPPIAVNVADTSQNVTLANGTDDLSITSIVVVGGSNPADFVEFNTCGGEVPPTIVCVITVTFTPSTTGPETSSVVITDATGLHTITLTGSGQSPIPPPPTGTITLNPTTLTFPSQEAGLPSASNLSSTLTVTGSNPVTLTGLQFLGTNPGDFTTSGNFNCPFFSPIAAGNSCTIGLSFRPLAGDTGALTATFAISGTFTGSPDVITLNGTATPSIASLSSNEIDFLPGVAINSTSAVIGVTLSNVAPAGGAMLTNIHLSTIAAPFAVQSTNCPIGGALAPGGSCNINFTFAPTQVGNAVAELTITDSDPIPQNVVLFGTGLATAATLAPINPTAFLFGRQPGGTQNSGQGLTLQNLGNAPLPFTTANTGANPAAFLIGNDCSSLIPLGGICGLSITFAPPVVTVQTPMFATVTIGGTAAGTPQSFTVSGTAMPSTAASLLPNPLVFPATPVNSSSAPLGVFYSNTGLTQLTMNGSQFGGANPGDFQINFSNIPFNAGCLFSSNQALNPGGVCVFQIVFTPTAPGLRTATFLVNDNGVGSPHTIVLQGGQGSGAPAVSFNVNPAAFGNQALSTTSGQLQVTLTNTGTAALNLTNVSALGGTNPGDFAVANTTTCTTGATVVASGSCVLNLTFTPTVLGARSALITFTDNAADSPETLNLTGTGTAANAPQVSLSTATLTFPAQNLNTTSGAQQVTVTNTGNANLTFTGFTTTGDFAETVVTSANPACSTTVPLTPASKCDISVTFKPTVAGTRNGTLSIADNAANSPQSVALTGTTTAPVVSLSVTSLTFPATDVADNSSVQTVTVTNTGNANLAFSALTSTGDFAVVVAGSVNPTCAIATPLTPTSKCDISVVFTPTAAGTRTGTLSIADNAANSPQVVTLTGTGIAVGPNLTITPSTTVNFGNQRVGTSSNAIVTTVTNTGNQAITLTTVTLNPPTSPTTGVNPNGFNITGNNLDCGPGTNLAASGGNCVLPVTFSPLAAGAVTSTITITDSLGTQVITLNGTGTVPTITLNPASLSFSTAPDTTSAAETVTLTNSGGATLNIANVTLGGTDAADFALVNGTTPCAKGVAVQPQAACTIGVNFTAPSQATFNATVTVTSDASNGAQVIPLTGTGVVISITPPPGGITTATTNPGGTAVFPLILSSTGITGTATLSCVSPSTPTITCTVVPGTVPLTPNGITHTAIVVNTFCKGTTPSSGSVPGIPTQNLPPAPWLIAIVGLALLASMALTKKRSLRLVMPLAALLLAGVFASSCGSPPNGPAGITPPGSYPLVITATVGQASSSITLTLNVN